MIDLNVGINGYGVYIPKYRIKAEEYLKSWGSFAARGVEEKTVPAYDEDAITMAVEASSNALRMAGLAPDKLEALYFASTSAPYGEKLVASTIGSALGASTNISTCDCGFSTKAGTSAVLTCYDFVASGRGKSGLAVASDSPVASPDDPMEHGFGAGACALTIGSGETVATIDATHSVIGETLGERFRRFGNRYTKDLAIRPYTELVFNSILRQSITGLMNKLNMKAEDFNYLVVQQFDGRGPFDIGKRLGFKDTQVSPGLIANKVGDAGASSPLLGLAAVLDKAKPAERILVASYGSGAGSDAFSIIVEKEIENRDRRVASVERYLEAKQYVDYVTYLKTRKMLAMDL